MPSSPRVLVGSPTAAPYAYCLQDWIRGVKALTYPHCTVVLVDNTDGGAYDQTIQSSGIRALKYTSRHSGETLREKLAYSRDLLRRLVLDEGYDYFLSLEQDIIPPEKVIELLMRHQQPVVSGVYYKFFTFRHTSSTGQVYEKKKAMPLLARSTSHPQQMHFIAAEEVAGDSFFSVRYCGLGCVLIRRDVLERVAFRVDTGPAGKAFDDVYFCTDVLSQGFSLYVDTGVKCLHLLSGKPAGLFDELHRQP
ncbi:hypothetical protein HYS50_01205 [Candidatus Woesearchaeota archaeon]|nr:hypothetical protein [Candidatus Woesearchaeota archaeon]